jgi:cysteine desulfurase/selenocysteine lyase
MGVAASARASFYLYNTREEVDSLVEAVDEARQLFG